MTRPPDVTPEHLQRAYAQLRKPNWPTLEQMREAYVQFGVVRARAVALANGKVLPPEPVAAPPPEARPAPKPAPQPSPQRRRDDSYSTRAAQAGEYVHPDE